MESGWQLFPDAGDVDAKFRAFVGAVDVVHGRVVQIHAGKVPVCAELVELSGQVSECTDECDSDDLGVLDRRTDC